MTTRSTDMCFVFLFVLSWLYGLLAGAAVGLYGGFGAIGYGLLLGALSTLVKCTPRVEAWRAYRRELRAFNRELAYAQAYVAEVVR